MSPAEMKARIDRLEQIVGALCYELPVGKALSSEEDRLAARALAFYYYCHPASYALSDLKQRIAYFDKLETESE